jgi:hypothetical protein
MNQRAALLAEGRLFLSEGEGEGENSTTNPSRKGEAAMAPNIVAPRE